MFALLIESETGLRKLMASLEAKEKLLREDKVTLGACRALRASIMHQKGDLVSALHEANEGLTLRRETVPELFFNTTHDESGSNTAVSLHFQGYQLNQWSLLRDFLDSVDQSGKSHCF